MDVQGTNPHHHQEKDLKRVFKSQTPQTPEAELIALAQAKGQTLAAHTLRTVKETLELQGVALADFVDWARPHLQRGIHNPSGFLISRARNFHTLASPASAPPPPAQGSSSPLGTAKHCDCSGGFLLHENRIVPCPKCSTPESRREWDQKEAERERRANATNKTGGGELKPVSADPLGRDGRPGESGRDIASPGGGEPSV